MCENPDEITIRLKKESSGLSITSQTKTEDLECDSETESSHSLASRVSHAVLYGIDTDLGPKNFEFFSSYFDSKIEFITYHYLQERKDSLMKESEPIDCPQNMRKEEVIEDLVKQICQLPSLKDLISYMVANTEGAKKSGPKFFGILAKEEIYRQVNRRYPSIWILQLELADIYCSLNITGIFIGVVIEYIAF